MFLYLQSLKEKAAYQPQAVFSEVMLLIRLTKGVFLPATLPFKAVIDVLTINSSVLLP